MRYIKYMLIQLFDELIKILNYSNNFNRNICTLNFVWHNRNRFMHINIK